MRTPYSLIYSTHSGDDAPQNQCRKFNSLVVCFYCSSTPMMQSVWWLLYGLDFGGITARFPDKS